MPRALLTGCTGQDGSYLAELLLAKGYEVHGLVRRGASFNTWRIEHILPQLVLHHGDVLDPYAVRDAFQRAAPDEVYHLAAPSHVAESFNAPAYALDVITRGTLHVLEAARAVESRLRPRIYIASTSEMFGSSPPPQNETTPFAPRSPYAVAKLAAHQLAGVYRDAYGLWVACGILFNHESPRRLPTFVTRKVTRGLARIALAMDEKLELGELTPIRDWGHARDYVEAMWLMLQRDEPVDLVIATGVAHSVTQLLNEATRSLRDIRRGSYRLYWPDFVRSVARYERPLEVEALEGDASKARALLGWEPRTSFAALIDEMIDHDLAEAEREGRTRRT